MTAILTLLSNWKNALVAIFGVLATAMYGLLKYKSAKLEKAEHEIKIKDKKDEIEKSQDVFKAQVISNEQDEILKELDSNAKTDRNTRANSL